MTARKKAKGNQPVTRHKVPGTTKMDSSASRNIHGQKEVSNANPVTGPVFASPEDRQRKIEELAYIKMKCVHFT